MWVRQVSLKIKAGFGMCSYQWLFKHVQGLGVYVLEASTFCSPASPVMRGSVDWICGYFWSWTRFEDK